MRTRTILAGAVVALAAVALSAAPIDDTTHDRSTAALVAPSGHADVAPEARATGMAPFDFEQLHLRADFVPAAPLGTIAVAPPEVGAVDAFAVTLDTGELAVLERTFDSQRGLYEWRTVSEPGEVSESLHRMLKNPRFRLADPNREDATHPDNVKQRTFASSTHVLRV